MGNSAQRAIKRCTTARHPVRISSACPVAPGLRIRLACRGSLPLSELAVAGWRQPIRGTGRAAPAAQARLAHDAQTPQRRTPAPRARGEPAPSIAPPCAAAWPPPGDPPPRRHVPGRTSPAGGQDRAAETCGRGASVRLCRQPPAAGSDPAPLPPFGRPAC